MKHLRPFRLAAQMALVCMALSCATTPEAPPGTQPRGAFFPGGGGGAGHTVKEEGTPLTARTGLNCVGAGVTCTDDSGNDETDITVSGIPPDASISTAKIQDAAVTAAKIAADTIVAGHIATDGVGAAEIAAGAVDASELASTAITPGTYGSATTIPQCTYDADGRATACTAVTATPSASSVVTSPPVAGGANVQSALQGIDVGKVSIASSPTVNEGAGSPLGTVDCTSPAPQCFYIETGTTPDRMWVSATNGTGGWTVNSLVRITSQFAIGSTSGGLQEAINSCPRGASQTETCQIIIDKPITISTTVATNLITDSGSTLIYGLTLTCAAGSMIGADGTTSGISMTWSGGNVAMFRVVNVWGFRVERCGIKAPAAEIVFDLAANAVAGNSVQAPVFDHVWIYGDQDAADRPIGYWVGGVDPDGAEDLGSGLQVRTATSASLNSLDDTTRAWTVDEWHTGGSGCTAENDETCYVCITRGRGRGQCKEIIDNDTDTLFVASWDQIPDTTSDYKIQALTAVDGACTSCGTEFTSDAVDNIQWIGGGARGVESCIVVATTQSNANRSYGFECSEWNSTLGGMVVLAGQLGVDGGSLIDGSGGGPAYRVIPQHELFSAFSPTVTNVAMDLGGSGGPIDGVALDYPLAAQDRGFAYLIAGNTFTVLGDSSTQVSSGTATSGTTTTLVHTGVGWGVNEHAGRYVYVDDVSAPPLISAAFVTSNTADTLTLASTIHDVDSGDTYRIFSASNEADVTESDVIRTRYAGPGTIHGNTFRGGAAGYGMDLRFSQQDTEPNEPVTWKSNGASRLLNVDIVLNNMMIETRQGFLRWFGTPSWTKPTVTQSGTNAIFNPTNFPVGTSAGQCVTGIANDIDYDGVCDGCTNGEDGECM